VDMVSAENEDHDEVEDKAGKQAAEQGMRTTYWTDYCKALFHHRSHVELVARLPRFDLFLHGHDALGHNDQGEELMDQIRWFSEECDSVRGFLLPADVSGGFGGCARDVMTELADTYPRVPTAFLGLNPRMECIEPIYNINNALSTSIISEFSTIFSPICVQNWEAAQFHGVAIDVEREYHTAAVVASTFDAVTLPWRMAPHCCRDTIASTAGVLVRRPMANVACLDVALPLTTPDTFAYGERGHLVNLSSGGANSSAENSFSDHVVIRGVDVDAHNSASMLKAYMSPCRARTSFLWREPMRVPIPYPQFFQADPSHKLMSDVDASDNDMQVLEVLPILSRLHCGRAVQEHLEAVVHGFDTAQHHGAVVSCFTATGFEADEFVEMKERLLCMIESYDD